MMKARVGVRNVWRNLPRLATQPAGSIITSSSTTSSIITNSFSPSPFLSNLSLNTPLTHSSPFSVMTHSFSSNESQSRTMDPWATADINSHEDMTLLTMLIPKVMLMVAQQSSRPQALNLIMNEDEDEYLSEFPANRIPALCQKILEELRMEGYDPLSMPNRVLLKEFQDRIAMLDLAEISNPPQEEDRPETNFEAQIQLEIKALQSSIDRYRLGAEATQKAGHASEQAPVRRLLLSWYEPLIKVIKEQQKQAEILLDDMERQRIRGTQTQPNSKLDKKDQKLLGAVADKITLLGI